MIKILLLQSLDETQLNIPFYINYSSRINV